MLGAWRTPWEAHGHEVHCGQGRDEHKHLACSGMWCSLGPAWAQPGPSLGPVGSVGSVPVLLAGESGDDLVRLSGEVHILIATPGRLLDLAHEEPAGAGQHLGLHAQSKDHKISHYITLSQVASMVVYTRLPVFFITPWCIPLHTNDKSFVICGCLAGRLQPVPCQ